MRCGLYARVSTVDQDCTLQLRELRDYCARRNWTVAGEYVDTGWSGAKANRPQLDRIMQDASEHRIDAILVWKLDRFGRSVLNLSEQLARLNSWGIRFLATSQALDTDAANPTSRLLLHILAAVAEFEREMIRERVRAGMAAARHKGTHFGRPSATNRGSHTKSGKPQQRLDVRRARKLARAGHSQRAIADMLGVGKGTIGRLLERAAIVLIGLGISLLARLPRG